MCSQYFTQTCALHIYTHMFADLPDSDELPEFVLKINKKYYKYAEFNEKNQLNNKYLRSDSQNSSDSS